MTASAFANLLRARRIGRGKWTALCPSHPDRKPSLSIAEGKRGVLIKCMSNGCETRDILDALGLTFNDLFYDQATPAVRARTSLHEQREILERRLGLVIWLQAVDPGKRRYWQAAERHIRRELALIRCKIEPEGVYREWREGLWRAMNQKQRDKHLEAIWTMMSASFF